MEISSTHSQEMRFAYSGETVQVDLDGLRRAVVEHLGLYGEESHIGADLAAVVKDGSGEERFQRLLARCKTDESEFFAAILKQLEKANHTHETTFEVGGLVLPKRLILPILEVIIPGNGFLAIKSVEQFERLTNVTVPDGEREDLQTVIEQYPVRLSRHVIRQSRLSTNVAYQFMPFVQELDRTGHKNTWVGQFHQGLLEQMYQNRPIFVLHMSCPVYCRFCFRKHKDCRNQPTPTTDDVHKALQYIEGAKDIKEIVLTGGEPLMNRETLTAAVEGLSRMPHIQTIRIASRCISYYPEMFYKEDGFWLRYLVEKNADMARDHKRIEVATHFIHPDEVSTYSLDIIAHLVGNGVSVYTQTPFLKDCNDSGRELVDLYRQLRAAGSEMHYIYIPCSPIQGNNVYWTEISQGHEAAAHLRAFGSDRAMPIICTATTIGKIDWNASGWALRRDEDNPDDIWIRTPYSEEYFKKFAPNFSLMRARANDNGTLDVPFMARIGDDSLFLGHLEDGAEPEPVFEPERLARAQEMLRADQRVRQSIVKTPVPSLNRIHVTRVELDLGEPGDLDAWLEYIASDKRICDVVASARDGLLGRLDTVEELAGRLTDVGHVISLRLRSAEFTYQPELVTPEAVDRICSLNRLAVVNSLRVEIVAQFVHSSEFRDAHRDLITAFLARGVTVYNNILLITGVNDNPEEMKKMCYKCRRIGIELYHLYVAGLPVQLAMNAERPVEATDVVHIATHLRRHESGRELPLYVVRTALGEADFNLTGIPAETSERATSFVMKGYSEGYYRSMDPGFEMPGGAAINQDGCPVVWVDGIAVGKNRKFFLRGKA